MTTTSTNQAQSLIAENGPLQSPTSRHMKPISSFFNSPRFFYGFATKGFSETENAMSPTSILDNIPFSAIGNPFWSDNKTNPTSRLSPEPSLDNNKHPWEKKPEGIVDVLIDEETTTHQLSKPKSRMVLFGSQLKIQIPLLAPSVLSPSSSPISPADFGIKTKTPLSFSSTNHPTVDTPSSPSVFTGCLSASEMELSEDYTCVITHGPNPRTTHIFGDCIVEDCCGFVSLSGRNKENSGSFDQMSYHSEDFLTFCYNCKKNLGQGKDIYMYSGLKELCPSILHAMLAGYQLTGGLTRILQGGGFGEGGGIIELADRF